MSTLRHTHVHTHSHTLNLYTETDIYCMYRDCDLRMHLYINKQGILSFSWQTFKWSYTQATEECRRGCEQPRLLYLDKRLVNKEARVECVRLYSMLNEGWTACPDHSVLPTLCCDNNKAENVFDLGRQQRRTTSLVPKVDIEHMKNHPTLPIWALYSRALIGGLACSGQLITDHIHTTSYPPKQSRCFLIGFLPSSQ